MKRACRELSEKLYNKSSLILESWLEALIFFWNEGSSGRRAHLP